MARLPGMSPIDEGRQDSRRTALRQRVRTERPSQKGPGLRPTAAPVDTYARPEQTPIGANGWESLARTLSAIQPTIGQFLGGTEERANTPQDADYAEARRQLALIPDADQRSKAIRDGSIPALTTLAGREVAAERLAYDESIRLMEKYQTEFDQGTGNIDEFILANTKDTLERYGNDPVFMGIYTKQISSVSDKLRAQAVDDRSKYEMAKREGDVFGKWAAKADFELADGKAPADIAAGVFGEFKTNRDLLRLPFDRQQEMVLQLANQAETAGKLDLARAYLSYERTDGPYKGSLLTDAKVGQQATAVLERVNAAQLKIDLQNTAAEAEEQFGSILDGVWQRGEITSITPVSLPDKNGNVKEVSPDEAEKLAVQRALDRSRQIAAERKETPEQTTDRELAEFTGNAVKHPEWFRVMDAGASAATIPNVSLDQPPDALVQGYEKYKTLYGKAPTYVEANLNAKSADFYETVRVGEELGWDQRTAMSVAIRVNAPGASKDEAAQRVQFQKLNTRVSEVVSNKKVGGLFGSGFFGTSPINEGEVKTELNRYAQLYVKMGLGEDDAIGKAAERLEKNYFNFNGTLLKRDARMPPDFESRAQAAIRDFVVANKDQLDGDDESDLSLYRDGTSTGSWLIWNPNTKQVYGSLPGGVVSYRTMQEAKQREREAAEKAVVDKAANRKPAPQWPSN